MQIETLKTEIVNSCVKRIMKYNLNPLHYLNDMDLYLIVNGDVELASQLDVKELNREIYNKVFN